MQELRRNQRYLGISVERNREKQLTWIGQEAYVRKVIHRFNMDGGSGMKAEKKCNSPVAAGVDLNVESPPYDQKEYQQRIGSMMFAMVYTRPDIAFIVGRLSQYMTCPTVVHAQAVKRVLRYLRTTTAMKIQYGGCEEGLKGYSDADYGSDKKDRVSILGVVFTYAGGAISWLSRKQRSVSTSTTEAEYMALSTAGKQAKWLNQLVTELGRNQKRNYVEVCTDSGSALDLVKAARLNDRSKHIDIAFHHIRDLTRRRVIKVTHIPGSEMPADMLTKGLPTERFMDLLRRLQLQVT